MKGFAPHNEQDRRPAGRFKPIVLSNHRHSPTAMTSLTLCCHALFCRFCRSRRPRVTPASSDQPPGNAMSSLQHLLERNRRWSRDIHARPAGLLPAPRRAAEPALPVDRLLGQPRAGQRDRRPAAGRAVRPPQRRQRRRPHRPQLPVGAAVRGRRAARRARDRRRALRLRRHPRRAGGQAARAHRQLAAPRAGRRRAPQRMSCVRCRTRPRASTGCASST